MKNLSSLIRSILIINKISLNSAKQYNTRVVSEHLFQLLSQALKYHPNEVTFLRLMGDLNFGKILSKFYKICLAYSSNSPLMCIFF